jgi:uncharacterized membrane protein
MQGMNHEPYRLDRALELAGAQSPPQAVPTVARYSVSAYGEGAKLSVFPLDYDVLMRYDAIIACNVSMECLGIVGREMARDYLGHGGSLLVLGGKAAYAAGRWRDTGLADMLPVELEQSLFDIDRVEAGELAAGDAHWITDGLCMDSRPRVEYAHRVRARDGARVVLTAGGRPFLVVWERGAARVACVLGAPYGDELPGRGPLFFAWDEWPRLMARTLLWVGRRTAGTRP